MLCGLNELIHVKHLVQLLSHNKCMTGVSHDDTDDNNDDDDDDDDDDND